MKESLGPNSNFAEDPPRDQYSEDKPVTVSIVIPCFNEGEAVRETSEVLVREFDNSGMQHLEIVWIDDGSEDSTWEVLNSLRGSEKVGHKFVRLRRNFGHQAAILAGLTQATGRAVGVMDSDLQDPPSVLLEMFEQLGGDIDVVYGIRRKRKAPLPLRVAYDIFYRAVGRLSSFPVPRAVGDFRVMSRRVVDELLELPETDKFLRGLIPYLGPRSLGIEYDRPARRAGKTKFSFSKLLRLATSGIISVSVLPLRISTIFGFASAGVAFLGAFWVFASRLGGADWPDGWASLTLAVFLIGGLQMIFLGILGEYLGVVVQEVKRRPTFFIDRVDGGASGSDASGPGGIPS